MIKIFRTNKRILAVLSIFILVLVLGSCRSPATTESKNIKQKKKTALSAKEVANKFWNFMNKGQFGKAYPLIDPKSRGLLNKEDFIRASNAITTKPKVKVGTVIVNGKDANVALRFRTKSGIQNVSSKIIYAAKKWHQKLETDLLISYGIHPKYIPLIKGEEMGEEFSLSRFSALVIQANRETTGTTATAAGVSINVMLDVINKSDFPFSFSADQHLALFDDQSRFFSASTPGDSAVDVGPKSTESFKAVFDVPEDSKIFYLLIGKNEDKRVLVPLVL